MSDAFEDIEIQVRRPVGGGYIIGRKGNTLQAVTTFDELVAHVTEAMGEEPTGKRNTCRALDAAEVPTLGADLKQLSAAARIRLLCEDRDKWKAKAENAPSSAALERLRDAVARHDNHDGDDSDGGFTFASLAVLGAARSLLGGHPRVEELMATELRASFVGGGMVRGQLRRQRDEQAARADDAERDRDAALYWLKCLADAVDEEHRYATGTPEHHAARSTLYDTTSEVHLRLAAHDAATVNTGASHATAPKASDYARQADTLTEKKKEH